MNEMTKAITNLAISMIVAGLGLGALAGSLVSVTILLTTSDLSMSFIFSFLLMTVIWGGLFGMMFGGFSGAFSGIAMIIVTGMFFRETRSPRLYQYTMGIITFIVTGLVFMIGEFSALEITDHSTWLMVAFLSILIAVAASQRAASKYLREMDGRKVKEK